MQQSIRVDRPHDGETRITVADWPDPHAAWRVRTNDARGRELEVVGFSNFDQLVVARLTLHVQKGRKPLMITGHSFEDHLVTHDRPEVLGQLVLCAQAIARRLDGDLSVGNGRLLWQLERSQLAELSKRFPQFESVPRRRRPRPGKRYLLWRGS